MKQEFTVPNDPQQTAVTDRYIIVITEMIRYLLTEAKQLKMF